MNNRENKIYEILKKILTDNPNLVVGGSLSLKINGIKERRVNDIDLIVPTYDEFEKLKIKYDKFIGGNNSSSVNEEIGSNNNIYGFSCMFPDLHAPNSIKVDFLYVDNNSKINYKIYDIPKYGLKNIKVGTIEDVIDAKFIFLKNLKKISSFKKHILDILMLSQEMNEYSDIININKRLRKVLSTAEFWEFWEDGSIYDPELLNSKRNKQIEDFFEDDLPF